jgi:hypothetical protein
MLVYLAKVARTPYLTTRGPDTVSPVTNPMTVTQGSPVQLIATINYTWASNNYAQNVGGAEYYIGTPPWAGGTALPMQAVDGAFDEQNEPVQATIDTSSIPPGTYVVFVRGRGVNDYQGLGSWGPVSATWLTVTGGGTPTPTSTATQTQIPVTASPTCQPATCTFVPGVVDVGNHCDNCTSQVTFPFPFNFYGQNYVSATVSSNGIFSFAAGNPSGNNTCLPATGFGPSIFAYWDDLTTECVGCGIYTNVIGSAPNRTFIIEWRTEEVAGGGTASFEVLLSEGGSGQFRLAYGQVDSGGSSATVGWQNGSGLFTQYACNSGGIYNGLCLPLPPNPCATPTPPIKVTPITSTATFTATHTPPVIITPITSTSTATATATACTITFSDVPPNHTFYNEIRCLACRGVLGGYADGSFRPGADITRGQISKVVSNAAGFQEPVSGQTYQDVPPSHTFYEWIERLTGRGVMGGYACGGTGEPCVPPDNRPYFRPGASATRGQLSKIVANAASITDPVTGQVYEDVPPTHTFYLEIMRLTQRGVMSGYACGGPGEPCVPPGNRPYFRPGANVTRGQASKIVANTFFPNCEFTNPCVGVPPPLNMSIAPSNCGPAGSAFTFVGWGFVPNEDVRVFVVMPDGTAFGAPQTYSTDSNGVTEPVDFQTWDFYPTGLWRMFMVGVTSSREAEGPFMLTPP